MGPWAAATVLAVGTLAGSAARAADVPLSADAVRAKLDLRRGICVVTGDRQCKLARALAGGSELLVFVQLARDEDVQAAARAADAAGLYGRRIFVAKGPAGRIGLADDVADAAIVLGDPPDAPPKAEVLRVLRPGGKALAGDDLWEKAVPHGVDDWSHHYHGPDNNPQSRDELARAPLLMQFIAEPRFAPGPQSVVASTGRVFMALGHVAWHQREEPVVNTLIAINGLNGTELWKYPLKPGIMVDRSTMIATPATLYLADDTSCKLLDAATGKLRDEITVPADVAGGTFWKWMALDGGVLYALIGPAEPADPKTNWKRTAHGWPWQEISQGYNNDKEYPWGFARTLLAIDPKTKKILWRHDEDPSIDGRSLCMSNGRMFFCHFGRYLTCLDAGSGKVLWRRTAEKDPALFQAIGPYRPGQGFVEGWRSTVYMKCTAQAIYFVGPQVPWISALSADDGHYLWKDPVKDAHMVIRADGLYTIGAQFTKVDTKKLDPLSGAVLASYATCRRACTRSTGSADGIYFRSEEGSGRLDLASGAMQWISPMRPSCHIGVVIASGHLYWVPWACDCNLQLTGVICCGPAGDFDFDRKATDEDRLEIGVLPSRAGTGAGGEGADWPTYRHDNARTARSEALVPDPQAGDAVGLLWDCAGKAGAEPTAPVAAGGRVFAAGSDGIVRAIDAASGRICWTAYVGGSVRFPPTIAQGRTLVGSGDGWVYAFEAGSGQLLWRFRAAPIERRIPVFGLLLSTWPAASGVLVDGGTAYFAAGLTDYGGTYVYAIDAATGRIRWQNNQAGHIDAISKRGVACQGELLKSGDRLYLAGGNAASPGMFDVADGRCLNQPPTSAGSTAPRGCELQLKDGKVTVSGQTFYSRPDMPIYDGSLRWQPDVVTAKNATLACVQQKDKKNPSWRLVARGTNGDKPLWEVPLSGEPVRWGVAVDAEGRVIVALRNGHIECFGR
jgi:outer membrane protein assembly factor BamB